MADKPKTLITDADLLSSLNDTDRVPLGRPGSNAANAATLEALKEYVLVGAAGSGDVVGPTESVNNEIAIFDGITGKKVKSSGELLSSFLTTAGHVDTDESASAIHHSLGTGASQAARGDHGHNGLDVFPVTYYNDNLKYHGVALDLGAGGSWDSAITETGPIIKIDGIYYMLYGGWDGSSTPFPRTVEQGRAFRIGLATSTDLITWTRSTEGIDGTSLVIDWPTDVFKVTPEDIYYHDGTGTYYLLVSFYNKGTTNADSDAYEEWYYHTTNPALTSWTLGAKFTSNLDVGIPYSITNISLSAKQGDGYFYATFDEFLSVGKFQTRMLRTNSDPPLSGWTKTWGGSEHIVLNPESSDSEGTPNQFNIMGSRIWQDSLSGKFIILTTATDNTPASHNWSCLYLHWSDNIDGPYLTLPKPFYAADWFLEGRHYVVIPDADKPEELVIFTDAPYNGTSPTIGRFTTISNINNPGVNYPVVGNVATWDVVGNVVDSGTALSSLGGGFNGAPEIWNNTSQTIDTNLQSVSTFFSLADQDESVAMDLLMVDQTNTQGFKATVRGIRARGTLNAPQVPSSGDDIVSVTAGIYDGAVVQNTAEMLMEVDGTVSSGAAPAKIALRTKTGGSGAYTERLTVKNDGKVGINNTSPAYQLDVDGDINVASGHNFLVNGIPLSTGGGLSVSVKSASFNAAQGNHYIVYGADTGIVATLADGDTNGQQVRITVLDGYAAVATWSGSLATTVPSTVITGESVELVWSGTTNKWERGHIGFYTRLNSDGQNISVLDSAGSPFAGYDTTNRVGLFGISAARSLQGTSFYSPLQVATSTHAVAAYFTNTNTSAAGQGAVLYAQQDDGAAIEAGHRLGGFVFGGSEDSNHTITYGAVFDFLTTEAWSSTANGVKARLRLNKTGVDNSVVTMQEWDNGNIVLGEQTALATNATNGFAYMPSGAGAPSGTPTAYTGKVAFYYDTTNNQIYIYNGAWKKTAALT